MSEREPPHNYYPLTDLAWQGWSCHGLTHIINIKKLKKMKVFNTIQFTDIDSMKRAEKVATEMGLKINEATGMRVPEELQTKAGQVLKGTFTGIGEMRESKKGGSVYKAYQFSYDGKTYFILGELAPKGSEFNFKVAKRQIEVEKKDSNGNVIKEEVETFGFEYLGLVTISEKAPVIS